METPSNSMLSKKDSLSELLRILCCPACKGNVKKSGNKISCTKCRKTYRIVDGTPYMLLNEKK